MPFDAAKVLNAIAALPLGEVNLMEVCGTHTMAIARGGIKSLLPGNIHLLSGPGCPVCVTPSEVIDEFLDLAMDPRVIITSYGDMLRVPGSVLGDSLNRRRALGAHVEVVYSPVDAVALSKEHPDKEVVFLGVGFETTAPGTAAAVLSAKEQGIENFSVFSMLKTVEPALRTLIGSEGFAVDGFLCPGHVASIIGSEGFSFLPRDYGLAAVVSGFESEDILLSLLLLCRQLASGEVKVENEYRRAVAPQGNELAKAMMARCFTPVKARWRGLGEIEGSGLQLCDSLAAYDAEVRFGLHPHTPTVQTPCRCGDVICGRIGPKECPLFGRRCTPEDPVGPCMVSSEGACAAAYNYMEI